MPTRRGCCPPVVERLKRGTGRARRLPTVQMSGARYVGLVSLLVAAAASCAERQPFNLPPSPTLDEAARSRRQTRNAPPEDKIMNVTFYLKKSACDVHGDVMFPAVVPIEYGLVLHDTDFRHARGALSPYAVNVLGGGCIEGEETHARVKYCPRCRTRSPLG